MFLPVILVRDYGIGGWIVFAIPNVIGAAAMGWVIRSPGSSKAIVGTHRVACQMFSAVTIAFHLFFVIVVVMPLAQSLAIPPRVAIDVAMGGVIAASALLYIYFTRRPGSGRIVAIIVTCISLVAMAFVLAEMRLLAEQKPNDWQPILVSPGPNLFWLALVCIFGFTFCPYLDLTFHRARQLTHHPRQSFGYGFGVVFFSMIVFTLLYARLFQSNLVNSWIAIFLFIHIGTQVVFTIAVHARQLRINGEIAAIVAGTLFIAAVVAYFKMNDGYIVNHLRAGEVIYRLFMGFYGLVFPAYVWLVMLPGRGRTMDGRNVVVFAIAVTLAAPMFFTAFILGQMFWLGPGLGLVLASKLLTLSTAQQNSAPT